MAVDKSSQAKVAEYEFRLWGCAFLQGPNCTVPLTPPPVITTNPYYNFLLPSVGFYQKLVGVRVRKKGSTTWSDWGPGLKQPLIVSDMSTPVLPLLPLVLLQLYAHMYPCYVFRLLLCSKVAKHLSSVWTVWIDSRACLVCWARCS